MEGFLKRGVLEAIYEIFSFFGFGGVKRRFEIGLFSSFGIRAWWEVEPSRVSRGAFSFWEVGTWKGKGRYISGYFFKSF